MRTTIAALTGAALTSALVLGGVPSASAKTYDEPDVVCLIKRYNNVGLVRPSSCRLDAQRYLPFIGGRWDTWDHRVAVGTVWLKHPIAGKRSKVVNGRRYGKVHMMLSRPNRYGGIAGGPSNEWYFRTASFRVRGQWYPYWKSSGCDLFTSRSC